MGSQRVGHDWVTNAYTVGGGGLVVRTWGQLLRARTDSSKSQQEDGKQSSTIPRSWILKTRSGFRRGLWAPDKNTAAATTRSLQSCPTLCDPRDGSPPGSPRPWDSPGKKTGVGYHFLLQSMKVKSESEVAQSCPTPPSIGFSGQEYWSGVPLLSQPWSKPWPQLLEA